MENVSKALLIAAGMLLAVMLLTLLVVGYNRISAHYNQQTELLTAEQLDKFNKQFQNYNRDNIRGNELISLMNKIIDYNTSQAYQEGKGYKPIQVSIYIGNENINEFKYEIDGVKYGDVNEKIKINSAGFITNGANSDWKSDKNLVEITYTPSNLIQKAKDVGINNLTDTQLQKLTMEISNILMKDEDEKKVENQQNENRRIREGILENILKIDIATMDDGTYRTQSVDEDKIKAIKDIVSQYYQYTQFKRAYFKCENIIHDTETGRVVEMNFSVQTKNGHVQFN